MLFKDGFSVPKICLNQIPQTSLVYHYYVLAENILGKKMLYQAKNKTVFYNWDHRKKCYSVKTLYEKNVSRVPNTKKFSHEKRDLKKKM